MNIVLLESLAVDSETLEDLVKPLTEAGHSFKAYERNDDPQVLIEEAKDADVLMIANMPLKMCIRDSQYSWQTYTFEIVGLDMTIAFSSPITRIGTIRICKIIPGSPVTKAPVRKI